MKLRFILFQLITIGVQWIAAIGQVCEGRQSRRTAKDRLGESACGADRGDRSRRQIEGRNSCQKKNPALFAKNAVMFPCIYLILFACVFAKKWKCEMILICSDGSQTSQLQFAMFCNR